jgi:hypothetical protein
MHIGTMLLSVGCLHVVSAAFLYTAPLADVLRAGVLASVTDYGDRATALWFIVAGAASILLGACIRDFERRELALPRVLAPGLWLLTALVVIPMPTSGGWLFAPIAWLAQRRTRKALAKK